MIQSLGVTHCSKHFMCKRLAARVKIFFFGMTVLEALAHPYLAEYSDITDEPVANGPFVLEEGATKRALTEWKGNKKCVHSNEQLIRFVYSQI